MNAQNRKYPVIAQGYGIFLEPDGGYIFPYEEHKGIKRALSPCEDLNVQACIILEQCTGLHTVQEIVSILEKNLEDIPPGLQFQVESFLHKASQKGYLYYSDTPTQKGGLLQGSTRHYTPSRVLVETTANCNLRCRHCLVPAGEPQKNELTTAQFMGILKHFYRMGVKRLVLSGGEVLTKKGWEDLIHFCTQRFETGLLTNGVLITEEIADKMIWLKEVHVSLYGSDPETHERITGVKGSFQKVIEGISLLTERGVYVGVSVLIVPFNVHQLEDMVRLAISLKCKIVRVGVIYALGRGREKQWELTKSLKEQLNITIDNLQEKYEIIDVRWEENLEKGSRCGAGYSRWAVASNGDVYPCSVFRIPLGNVVKDNPVDILNSPAVKFLQELVPPHEELCSSCEYVYACNQCHGQAVTHSFQVDLCRWAQQFETAPESLKSAFRKV